MRSPALARLAPLAVAVALAASCSSRPQLDSAAVEAQVVDFARKLQPQFLTKSASCPSDVSVKAGERFECTVAVADQTTRWTVQITDAHGHLALTPESIVIDMDVVRRRVVDTVAQQRGHEATANCGNDRYRTAAFGDHVVCRARAGAATIDVTVAIAGADGSDRSLDVTLPQS